MSAGKRRRSLNPGSRSCTSIFRALLRTGAGRNDPDLPLQILKADLCHRGQTHALSAPRLSSSECAGCANPVFFSEAALASDLQLASGPWINSALVDRRQDRPFAVHQAKYSETNSSDVTGTQASSTAVNTNSIDNFPVGMKELRDPLVLRCMTRTQTIGSGTAIRQGSR
jgi:hypothetical protein